MKLSSLTGTIFSAFVVVTLIMSPLASAQASRGGDDDHEDRGNHYGWYKQEQKWNKNRFENRSYFPFYGYNSTANLEAYIAQLQALLRLLQSQTGNGNYSDLLNVSTRAATSIDDTEATLRGYLDFQDGDTAEVYFEYGTNRNNLSKTTSREDLEDTDTAFSKTVTDLNEDTLYYFRAVAIDEDDERDYGTILSFYTTGTANSDDEPTVTTKSATSITDNDAELRGTVDMNDFDNGRVFFVYGTDEDAVDDAADEDRYSDITEDGDDLMKDEVDDNLDGIKSYTLDVSGLDNDTTYYFRIAVEYEDEDGDDTIEFGSIKSFTTEN